MILGNLHPFLKLAIPILHGSTITFTLKEGVFSCSRYLTGFLFLDVPDYIHDVPA